MAISRLQASLAQVTNEVTVAAANINFDFTLVKCEAPKEYHDLGKNLSKRRRDNAETGQSHITARRLGALFERICPATPNLIKAYGTRASEIAAYAEKEFAEPSNAFFAEQSGIDGTTIWAAATSSAAAIHVQLLACMLARVWNAQEATSVWSELVEGRRKEIAGRYEDGESLHFATLTAATQTDISRANLAEWDAGARAWLRTADRVKSYQQRQLMLIIANMNIPVNSDMVVYSSVISAWKSALVSMENLVCGIPQATDIGPPLLALSSWHLYPNLLAVKEKEVWVKFDDPLVSPGGHLTIGLAAANGEGRGVFWSLSLTRLNFYGSPVTSEGQYNTKSEKLTFHQFLFAVLGAVMGAWNVQPESMDEMIELFVAVDDFLIRITQRQFADKAEKECARKFLLDRCHWWNLLSSAARSFKENEGSQSDEMRKLIHLGIRRSSAFIPGDEGRARSLFFGLCDPPVFLSLLKDDADRIEFLRFTAQQSFSGRGLKAAQESTLVIRIRGLSGFSPQYLTALPLERSPCHHRWISYADQKAEGESWSLIHHQQTITKGLNRSYHHFVDTNTGSYHEVVEIYGDSNAAICQDPSAPPQGILPAHLSTLIWYLHHDRVDVFSFLKHLNGSAQFLDTMNRTMRALSAASKFYKSMPNAMLNVKAVDRPLCTAAWANGLQHSQNADFEKFEIPLDRRTAFACVAYMEAFVDIHPSAFDSVFAVAYEDSLYIAMPLLCDPWEVPASFELRCVLGNVGRPGVTMLIPPSTQMIRSSDSSAWRIATTQLFDGHQQDLFASTSVHLSFTEYYRPLHLAGRQQQDSQVFYLESYIKVYDAGKWVGDVDVLKSLSDMRITRVVIQCRHTLEEIASNNKDVNILKLMSAESWQDILDPPFESFVVRAHSNWVARLAALSMLLQVLPETGLQGILVCPPSFCWSCEAKRQSPFMQGYRNGDVGILPSLRDRAYIF